MLKELQIYKNLYEACYIYLNRHSSSIKFSDDKLQGMINAYIVVLNDERILAQTKKNEKDFCEWYLNYYKEEIGD